MNRKSNLVVLGYLLLVFLAGAVIGGFADHFFVAAPASGKLTPDQYRAKWKLPSDYPMVAPNYAARRSTMAKAIGLGQLGGKTEARRRGRPSKSVQA